MVSPAQSTTFERVIESLFLPKMEPCVIHEELIKSDIFQPEYTETVREIFKRICSANCKDGDRRENFFHNFSNESKKSVEEIWMKFTHKESQRNTHICHFSFFVCVILMCYAETTFFQFDTFQELAPLYHQKRTHRGRSWPIDSGIVCNSSTGEQYVTCLDMTYSDNKNYDLLVAKSNMKPGMVRMILLKSKYPSHKAIEMIDMFIVDELKNHYPGLKYLERFNNNKKSYICYVFEKSLDTSYSNRQWISLLRCIQDVIFYHPRK